MYIRVKSDFFKANKISPSELLTYASICHLSGYISIKAAAYNLYGEEELTRRVFDKYRENISSLARDGIIDIKNINGDIYYLEEIVKPESHYILIPFEYVQKIAQSNFRGKEFLFTYLCWVISSRINNMNIGVQKISYFAHSMNISENTIIRYNEILENMHIIYIRRENDNKGRSNCYGLYEDKDAVDEYASRNDYGNDTHITANWLRSVSQKYNYAISHPEKEISCEDAQKFLSYNKYCEERRQKDPAWEKQPLDLTNLKINDIILVGS